MNKVILIGRLTKDPEIRFTQSGKSVASFSLAVSRGFNKNTEQTNVDFIPVIAWEKLADICSTHLQKGRKVSIEGKLRVRHYDGQDGSKRYITEVIAQEIEFLGSKPDMGSSVHENGAYTFGSEVLPDEEIPF